MIFQSLERHFRILSGVNKLIYEVWGKMLDMFARAQHEECIGVVRPIRGMRYLHMCYRGVWYPVVGRLDG